jgi:hypothetical protein
LESRPPGFGRGFIQFLLGNPLLLACAGLGIALLLTGLAAKAYKSRSEHWHTQFELVQAQFGAFRMEVEAAGEKAKKESAAKELHDKLVLQEKQKFYETQLNKLRSERNAARRVLDHYASATRSEVPRVPESAGTSEQGQSDTVPRSALEQLARDAQETTLMFNECRDSWKAISAKP